MEEVPQTQIVKPQVLGIRHMRGAETPFTSRPPVDVVFVAGHLSAELARSEGHVEVGANYKIYVGYVQLCILYRVQNVNAEPVLPIQCTAAYDL